MRRILLILLLLLTRWSARGAPAAVKPSSAVSEAQLERWTRTWRKRLALEDWEVSTQLVRSTELRPDTLGNLRWNAATKTAVIRVLHPMDYELPVSEIPSDMEYTVVHELVHLQLAALPRDPANKTIEEKVVSKIAEALMALENGPSYRPRKDVAHYLAKDKAAAQAGRAARALKP